MANVKVKDADGTTKYMSASGAGSDGDAFIPVHTANLSATDNQVLDDIAASLAALDNSVDGNCTNVNINVAGTDIAAGAGATNAQTIRTVPASDGTQTVSGTVAVSGTVTVGSHAVTNAGTFATQVDGAALTALQLIDNMVSGSGANISQINGVTPLMGAGATGTGSLRVTAASDSPDTTALQIIDDWDESDRAKVNLVVGQAGITAGAGAVAANTPRVTLASDDPAVTALQLLDNSVDGSCLNANMNVAGTDIAAGAGTTNAQTIRTVPASDGTQTVSGTVTANLSATDNAVLDAAVAVLGATDGAKVITDANGTIQQYLRGMVALMIDTTAQSVRSALDTQYVYNGSTACTPKFAVIDAATSGNNTLVAAVSSKKIRVLSAYLVSAGTVTVRFESGADGTALTGQSNLVANTGFVLPFNPVGWFETGSNTLLNLELSAAVSVDGALTYIEV
jgi:hypothetical protein